MPKEKPNLKLVQKRIANIAIGGSTLRNQGAKDVTKKAIDFCLDLDLRLFSNVQTEEQFINILDELTKKLMDKFPAGVKQNYGAARKAINIFLEEVFYNRFLFEEYQLGNLGPLLEVPLDKDVANGLIKDIGKEDMPAWISIKGLKSEDSRKFQDAAKEIAKKKEILRIFLDLEYWRRN